MSGSAGIDTPFHLRGRSRPASSRRANRMRIRWTLAAVLLMCQGPGTTCFASGGAARRSSGAAVAAASPVPPLARTRSRGRAAATLMADSGAAPGARSRVNGWLVRNRSLILLICLVLHKCASDMLTRYTRVQGAYSINTVAMCAAALVNQPAHARQLAHSPRAPSDRAPQHVRADEAPSDPRCDLDHRRRHQGDRARLQRGGAALSLRAYA